jgi:hypothetical protein
MDDIYIQIITNDNIIFNINTKILKISQFLNSLENNDEIILPNINNICFFKILEFLEEYTIINDENDSYLKNIDDNFIFELLNASNYLLIDPLINILKVEIYNRILQKINEEKLFSYILTDENI